MKLHNTKPHTERQNKLIQDMQYEKKYLQTKTEIYTYIHTENVINQYMPHTERHTKIHTDKHTWINTYRKDND